MVYIAGPLSAADGYSVEDNARAAVHQYFRLIHKGINAFCPHLVCGHPAAWDIPYERWMAYDFALIDASTHVLMLPRWESSRGAMREYAYAELANKVIVYSEAELEAC